jgi:hypothetical protein
MTREESSHRCGPRGPWIARRVVRGIVMALAFGLLFGVFVRLLWNWLMPGMFGFHEITFGQAFGMVILARLLFGARGMHHMRPEFADRWHGHHRGGWGPCSKEHAANGEIKDWQYYDAWWQAEGREAFKKYTDSQGQANESEPRGES